MAHGPAVEPAGVHEDTHLASTRSLLKRILIYLPGSVVPAILGLVTSMVFTRIFTTAEFGLFSLAAVVIAAPMKVISTTWLVQSVGKFLPPAKTDSERRSLLDAAVLSIVLIIGVQFVVGVGAFIAGRYLLADIWGPFLLPVVLFIAATSLFEILSAIFPAEAKATDYTTFKLIDSIFTLVLRLLLVSGLIGMDVTLMIWSVVISNGILVPLMWWRAGLSNPLRVVAVLRSAPARQRARAFTVFGFPMTLWLFSSILLDVGDRWVIKLLLGAESVGIYDASYRLIAGLAALMVVPVTITVHPYVMSLSGVNSDDRRTGQVIGTVVDKLAVVAVLSVGLTFVLRNDIALVLLGPAFREGSSIMPVVLAGVFLANIGTFAHKPFEIVGRTRPMVVAAFASAAANLGLCFLLIPQVGYIGAAYATFIAYLLYTLSIGALGRRVIAWQFNVRGLLKQTAVVITAVGVIEGVRWLLHAPYVVELAGTGVACVLLAAGVLWFLLKRNAPIGLEEEAQR